MAPNAQARSNEDGYARPRSICVQHTSTFKRCSRLQQRLRKALRVEIPESPYSSGLRSGDTTDDDAILSCILHHGLDTPAVIAAGIAVEAGDWYDDSSNWGAGCVLPQTCIAEADNLGTNCPETECDSEWTASEGTSEGTDIGIDFDQESSHGCDFQDFLAEDSAMTEALHPPRDASARSTRECEGAQDYVPLDRSIELALNDADHAADTYHSWEAGCGALVSSQDEQLEPYFVAPENEHESISAFVASDLKKTDALDGGDSVFTAVTAPPPLSIED